MVNILAELKCETDERRIFALDEDELSTYSKMVWGWKVVDDSLVKEFPFPNFVSASVFSNKIVMISEQQNHHPKICIEWGKATITLTTHSVGGLSKNDFIIAAKIDKLLLTKD